MVDHTPIDHADRLLRRAYWRGFRDGSLASFAFWGCIVVAGITWYALGAP